MRVIDKLWDNFLVEDNGIEDIKVNDTVYLTGDEIPLQKGIVAQVSWDEGRVIGLKVVPYQRRWGCTWDCMNDIPSSNPMYFTKDPMAFEVEIEI